jgi:hypothetical protein
MNTDADGGSPLDTMQRMSGRHDLLERVLQLSDGPFSHELARHILNLHIPAPDQARYEELSAKAQDARSRRRSRRNWTTTSTSTTSSSS